MEEQVITALLLGICVGVSFMMIILISLKTEWEDTEKAYQAVCEGKEKEIKELEERNDKLAEIINEIGEERKNGNNI